jgi:hypothetical protein
VRIKAIHGELRGAAWQCGRRCVQG